MMNRITGFLLALMSFCSTWKAFSCVTDGATVGMDFQIFTCMFVGLSVARNDGNICLQRRTVCSFSLPVFTVRSHRNKAKVLQCTS